VRIGTGASKKIIIGKKKDADKNGISIGITGIVRSSSIAGRKISSFLLSGTARNAMVMIGMTDQIGSIRTITAGLMGRLGGERRFMISWGADSVCMIGLEIELNIFPGIKKSLRKWLMHGFPMSSYFAGTLTLIGWSQGKRRPSVKQQQLSPWCPEGLTRTQKRRLQRERREELSKGENSGQPGDQQQSDPKGKGPSTDVNMVFMLPMEFLAPSSDDEGVEFSDQIAQLALDPMTAIFEKPADNERQHLKALFVKGRVDG